MFKITFDLSITGLVSLAIAGVSLIVAHTSKKKLDRVCDKLDIAHDKIMDKDFDLEGYVTQKVIEDVVRDRAEKKSTIRFVRSQKRHLKRRIRSLVRRSRSRLTNSIRIPRQW